MINKLNINNYKKKILTIYSDFIVSKDESRNILKKCNINNLELIEIYYHLHLIDKKYLAINNYGEKALLNNLYLITDTKYYSAYIILNEFDYFKLYKFDTFLGLWPLYFNNNQSHNFVIEIFPSIDYYKFKFIDQYLYNISSSSEEILYFKILFKKIINNFGAKMLLDDL